MNTNDPTTWHDISSHPTFEGGEFDRGWYDGDVDADLEMLRVAATDVLSRFPQYGCELFVLDDCTMYVTVDEHGTTVCSIYPAKTDEYKPCYFLDVEGHDEEIRVKTVSEIMGVLVALAKGNGLDQFNS